jgi:hypothetical protein
METITCAQVRAWLDRDMQDQPEILTQLLAHISTCATCQGALMLLVDEELGTPALHEVVCEQFEEDLPAFMEHDGPLLNAIRAYPHVWWHLYTCPDCHEMYELVHVLRDAEQAGVLTPPPHLRRVTPPRGQAMRLFSLSRQLLNASLQSPLLHSTNLRGEEDSESIIAEREVGDGLHVNLSVLAQADGDWRITVMTNPPAEGWLVLKLGITIFRSQFKPSGIAVISAVPDNLLREDDGPDLEVAIESDDME